MMSTLLLILKILGIAFLVLLGILLLIIIVILFVPIRYKGDGVYDDENARFVGRITWLMHLISAQIKYEKTSQLHIFIKILGITVYDNLKNTKKDIFDKNSEETQIEDSKYTKSSSEEDVITKDVTTNNTEEKKYSEVHENTEKRGTQQITVEVEIENETVENTNNKKENDREHDKNVEECLNSIDNDAVEEEETSLFEKIKLYIDKIKHSIQNIKYTIKKMYDTMIKIKGNIKYYVRLWQAESTQRAFSKCKKRLKQIIKSIAPRRFKLNLHLGFDDISITGEIMALYGMLYPVHNGSIDLLPDFEKNVVEGDIFFKGKITICIILWVLGTLYFDKDIKLFVKRFKRN